MIAKPPCFRSWNPLKIYPKYGLLIFDDSFLVGFLSAPARSAFPLWSASTCAWMFSQKKSARTEPKLKLTDQTLGLLLLLLLLLLFSETSSFQKTLDAVYFHFAFLSKSKLEIVLNKYHPNWVIDSHPFTTSKTGMHFHCQRWNILEFPPCGKPWWPFNLAYCEPLL